MEILFLCKINVNNINVFHQMYVSTILVVTSYITFFLAASSAIPRNSFLYSGEALTVSKTSALNASMSLEKHH
jgi:hypothetical protein